MASLKAARPASDDDTFEITDETPGVFQYGGTD